MNSYEDLFQELRKNLTHNIKAKFLIPKMCDALREEDPTLSDDEIKKKVKNDCDGIGLDPEWVITCLPDWLKDKTKQHKKKPIEITVDGQTIPTEQENPALLAKQNFKSNDIEKHELIPTIPPETKKEVKYFQMVVVELSQDDCREIKSGSILSGRKFQYDMDNKRVVKWL